MDVKTITSFVRVKYGLVRKLTGNCKDSVSYEDLLKVLCSFKTNGDKRKMLKTNLKVETQNEPCIFNLAESEQRVFFEKLFERILKLCNKGE